MCHHRYRWDKTVDVGICNNTYIHNWSLQSFGQDYDPASYTTYVVHFNFIYECRDLQFKVDSERQIFEKLFMSILSECVWHIFRSSAKGSLTYTHNWSLQSFGQDYDPASHTTYVVHFNFIHECRDLQFKVDSE